MKTLAFILPALVLLAACDQAPEPAPAPEQPTPEPTASLPATDQDLFTTVFEETCEGAEPVNTAVCKRAGLGSDDAICEFGLGDDTYLRNTATLTANDAGDGWVLADPEKICTELGATPVDQ
ncbi:MAG: hypothetical protein GW855_12465 [Erythrobacter sp.]|nr:hypothetical protein [Erythrobacter sp.]NCQ63747.1 hypothetical protein [Alphaproteobacteria bacterium]